MFYCSNGKYFYTGGDRGGEVTDCFSFDQWNIDHQTNCQFGYLPPVDDPLTLTNLNLEYGMDRRFVEPWFECEVNQRFNDGISGYIGV